MLYFHGWYCNSRLGRHQPGGFNLRSANSPLIAFLLIAHVGVLVFVGTGAAGCFDMEVIHRVVVDCLFMSKIDFFLFFFWKLVHILLSLKQKVGPPFILAILEIKNFNTKYYLFGPLFVRCCIVNVCLRLVPGSATVH